MTPVLDLLDSPGPIKWLFYGDSITHGAYHTMGWRDYTELFAERVRYEMQRYGDIVIKTATNGDTTRNLLESFDWRVGQFQPSVVFIMIGTNDCCVDASGIRVPLDEFRDNLETLISRIRGLNGAIPVLQTPCPLVSGGAPTREQNFPTYVEMIRSVARASEVPLIDHVLYWQELAEARGDRSVYWMSDAFHPNEMGHRVFAELIFKRFNIHSPDAGTGRFFYA